MRKVNLGILTTHERELLDIASSIIQVNFGRVVLTGSLALAIQGIIKRREVIDIDLCAVNPYDHMITQIGAEKSDDTNKYDDEYFAEFYFKGEIIQLLETTPELLQDNIIEYQYNDKVILVLDYHAILKYKKKHSLQINVGNPTKHMKDLQYIMEHNEDITR